MILMCCLRTDEAARGSNLPATWRLTSSRQIVSADPARRNKRSRDSSRYSPRIRSRYTFSTLFVRTTGGCLPARKPSRIAPSRRSQRLATRQPTSGVMRRDVPAGSPPIENPTTAIRWEAIGNGGGRRRVLRINPFLRRTWWRCKSGRKDGGQTCRAGQTRPLFSSAHR